jgi:hypothetical protein
MCSICNHPHRIEVERDLLACPSVAAVAAHYRLPLEEVRQHQARLEARVEHARRQVEQLQLTESLARLELLLEKTMLVLTKAEENGDQKMMLQAIREAGRLTKMLHSLEVDLEASSLFLGATSGDWVKAASLFPTQPQVRESVRQAIRQSLLTPCAGTHLDAELLPPPAPVPEKSVPSVPKARASRRPRAAVIPRPSALGSVTVLEAAPVLEAASALGTALTPPEAPAVIESSQAGPGKGPGIIGNLVRTFACIRQ